jgi:hypothetical protein
MGLQMYHDNVSRAFTLVMLVPVAIGLLTGCAVKQKAWGDPQTGLVLTYRMPDDQSLRYRMTFEQTHSMQTPGQARSADFDRTLEFSMKSEGASEDNHDLTITVDSLVVELDTPRGEMKREIAELHGKSFGMVLSALGEASSFSGGGEVRYEMPPAGTLSVQTEFEGFFPNLANGPLRVGDSWSSANQVTDTAFNSGKRINLESVHTLTGFETVEGMECAKITTSMHGMLDETGERMTRTPEMTGSFEGTGVWYFAYEEGLLVRSSMTLRGAGVMTTGGGKGPPGRMSQVMTIDVRLLP